MRRSIVVLAMAVVFVLAMTAAALAGPGYHGGGNQYGKAINFHCGTSYGQLVKTAKATGHVDGPVSGVKSFVEYGLFAAHCLPQEPQD